MSIEPRVVYDTFTFWNDNNGPLWTIRGKLSGELVAGLLVGLETVLDFMNDRGAFTRVVIESLRARISVISVPLTEYDTTYSALTKFTDFRRSTAKEVAEWGNYRNKLPVNSFGWWIKHKRPNEYLLYTFKSSEFVQGFITICSAFNVDFRDYILGGPLKDHDDLIVYYDIEGHNIDQIIRDTAEPF